MSGESNTKKLPSSKGRPRKHPIPYDGDSEQMEAVFREYLDCVADCFQIPYDDREARPDDAPSFRDVCSEFYISIPKARKLLITAGVYSTEQSRCVAGLQQQGRSMTEMEQLTGLKRSSISSYLPYQRYAYHMDKASGADVLSRHAEDSRRYRERKKAVELLQQGIRTGQEHADDLLWQAVTAYQNYPLRTATGLQFSYTVKCKKNGEYSGELLVSRKEGSKTLTKSSVLLACHKVLEKTECVYSGPKAIGQIFGISYVYSLFWKFGLIKVPEKVENRMKGK